MKFKNVFIIAEVSANHGQNFDRAVKMIRSAKSCGADAVKFQAYTPDTITINCRNKYFRISHPQWGHQTLYQLYQKAYTPWEWFPKLKKVADNEGILFFATAFDNESVDMLEGLSVPFHKIASFELVDIPLIQYAASKRKPLIMSTGMASLSEIQEAVFAARKKGCKDIALLKCVSAYPASAKAMNLRTINCMKERFGCMVGISDHTLSHEVSVAAVALGARIVEKHFLLDKKHKTPDSFFSLLPSQFKDMVKSIRIVESALGREYYGVSKDEAKSLAFRRSLFVVKDIKKGDCFTPENIRSIRPSFGLAPKYLSEVLKEKAVADIKAGTPLSRKAIKRSKGRK